MPYPVKIVLEFLSKAVSQVKEIRGIKILWEKRKLSLYVNNIDVLIHVEKSEYYTEIL